MTFRSSKPRTSWSCSPDCTAKMQYLQCHPITRIRPHSSNPYIHTVMEPEIAIPTPQKRDISTYLHPASSFLPSTSTKHCRKPNRISYSPTHLLYPDSEYPTSHTLPVIALIASLSTASFYSRSLLSLDRISQFRRPPVFHPTRTNLFSLPPPRPTP